MARILVVCLLLTLAGCAAAPPDQPAATTVALPTADAAAQGALPDLVEAPAAIEPGASAMPSTSTTPDAGTTAGTAPSETAAAADQKVMEAVDSLPIEAKPALCVDLLSPPAFDLIVQYETAGRATYERRYIRPIWPGASSGATIGVGYDLGHASPQVILADWAEHPQQLELPRGAGVTGQAARAVTAQMQHVTTQWPLAQTVFRCTSVINYWRITERSFGKHFANVSPNAQGALVSLVYNRGGSMTGDRRREMRVIRDECLPRQDYACIAGQLRAMNRIWKGTDIEAGMQSRRNAEARLATTP